MRCWPLSNVWKSSTERAQSLQKYSIIVQTNSSLNLFVINTSYHFFQTFGLCQVLCKQKAQAGGGVGRGWMGSAWQEINMWHAQWKALGRHLYHLACISIKHEIETNSKTFTPIRHHSRLFSPLYYKSSFSAYALLTPYVCLFPIWEKLPFCFHDYCLAWINEVKTACL